MNTKGAACLVLAAGLSGVMCAGAVGARQQARVDFTKKQSSAIRYLKVSNPGEDDRIGIGDPLVGRSLLFEALEGSFTEINLRKDPGCPVCGEHPTITDYIDYVEFCTSPSRPAEAPAGQSPAPPRPAVAAPSIPSGAVQSTVPSGLNGAATSREAEEGRQRT